MELAKYQSILDNVGRYVTLSESEAERFVSIIRTTQVKRRQFIVQPGFVCQHRYFKTSQFFGHE